MKKEIILGTIVGILIGGIVFGSVGSVVAYNFAANQIAYTPQNSGWKVNSVNEAIDDLYIKKAGENYSTNETVVGTWIDGRPIYQKVIDNLSLSGSYNSWITITTIENLDIIVDWKAIGQNKTINLSGTGIEVHNNNGTVRLEYNQNVNVRGINIFIIQYTKTSDLDNGENNQG